MNILDAISGPDASVEGTILVFDIADSTRMKEEQEEVAWLANYAKAFEIVARNIPASGAIVKYLGDGIMIFFGQSEQTSAVNAAIKIQEEIDSANDKNRIKCVFSCGIASGQFKKIPASDGKFDYIGQVVDRAFRLCSAAMPRAIFVDSDTIADAQASKISSVVGFALKRTKNDYLGKEESISLKGFSKPVPFHSIHWSSVQFGVKPSHGGRGDPVVAQMSQQPKIVESMASQLGQFLGWHGNSGRVSSQGREFFCHKGSVVPGFA